MPSICVSCLAIEVFIVVTISSVLSVLNGSVMVIGDKVEFKCSANESSYVVWSFTPWNSSQTIEIYLGYDIIEPMRPRYRIDKKISGQHNLIIESVDMAHAGTYQCTSVNFPKIGTTHLTVLGSNPECGANASHADGIMMENDYLWMWCRITYVGDMIPVFSWTKSNTQNAIVANETTSGNREVSLIKTSSVITKLSSSDNGVTFRCKITFQMPNNTGGNVAIYEHTWNYTLYGTSDLPDATLETDLYSYGSVGTTPVHLDHVPIKAFVIGGSLLLLLIIIIVSCVFHRRRLKGGTSNRPDVALETDLNSYDDIGLRSRQPLNYILDADSSRGSYNDNMIADNLVYAEVKKPKGTREEKRAMNDQPSAIYADVKKKVNVNDSSNGRTGANHGEKSQPSQTPNPGNKNCIGDDGTVYAELGEMKQQPTNKVQSAKPPVFSQVEIYASIDHRGIVPPPPPKL